MKRIGETLLVLALIGCSDLPGPAPREAAKPKPAPLVLQSGELYCTEPGATLSSGALYKVCVDPAKWNRDLVVFIPGYHDPASALSLPDDFSKTPVSLLFSTLGYGFASTSFRSTGLIDRATWVGGDLLELVETAKTLLANTTGRTARFVYQTGGSQGGLGTVMAVEQYPNTFSGGLAGCGPIPGWPVWKQDLGAGNPGYVDPASWDAAERDAGAALDDPGNADRISQVLRVTHAPVDPRDPATIKGTTLGILWYSFRGTNDAIAKAGGMPFDNRDRHYSGSSDDDALNAGVERFQATADAAKVAPLQTAARLRRPLVTIHDTGDPIVPVWHESLYRSRLNLLGRLLHTPITVQRYGHCNFTDAELLAAFAVLVLKVSGQDLLVARSALPEVQARASFLSLARQHGARPALTR